MDRTPTDIWHNSIKPFSHSVWLVVFDCIRSETIHVYPSRSFLFKYCLFGHFDDATVSLPVCSGQNSIPVCLLQTVFLTAYSLQYLHLTVHTWLLWPLDVPVTPLDQTHWHAQTHTHTDTKRCAATTFGAVVNVHLCLNHDRIQTQLFVGLYLLVRLWCHSTLRRLLARPEQNHK